MPAAEEAADAWAQCDACGKWRRLPTGVAPPGESARWECAMLEGGCCGAPEEAEDESEAEDEFKQALMAVVGKFAGRNFRGNRPGQQR